MIKNILQFYITKFYFITRKMHIFLTLGKANEPRYVYKDERSLFIYFYNKHVFGFYTYGKIYVAKQQPKLVYD